MPATETMKLSRAAKRQLRIDKLCHDLRNSRLSLRPFRINMKEMIRLDAGGDWSDNAADLRRPYNGISIYKQVMRRALLNQTPRAMLSTWRRDSKRLVSVAQNWSNKQFKKINLGVHLDRAITNALFWMGIMKTGITTPIDAANGGYSSFAGDVYSCSVHPDDWVGDTFSTNLEDMGYSGHRYRGDVDVANRFLNLTGDEKLDGEPSRQFDADGDERVAMIARGYVGGDDNSYRDMADFWEIWVPQHRALLTFRSQSNGAPSGEDDLLRAEKWIGPECGPYTYFAFVPVSGQLVPKGPIVDQVGTDVAVNVALRKLIRQADRFKQLDLYSGAAKDDMERINYADDGEAVQVNNPNMLKPWMSSPPNPQLYAMLQAFKGLHSQVCGNLEVLGGLARQAGTARQEELMSQNATATLSLYQSVVLKGTQKVMEDCLWYWWHDQTGEMTDVYSLDSNPDVQMARTVGPQDRGKLKWEDLEIQVDPYSLTGDTPQGKRQQLRELLNTYAPLAQFFQQQGVVLDGKEWFRKEGEYSNNPDVADLLHLTEPTQGQDDDEGPGMPANTNRTYTRKSESEATQAGQEEDSIQQLMGAGAPEAGAYGGGQ